jgi:hypothetical protein
MMLGTKFEARMPLKRVVGCRLDTKRDQRYPVNDPRRKKATVKEWAI